GSGGKPRGSVSRQAWSWCQERFLKRGSGCGFGASGNSTGGNPAVPSSEFISARFSARRRDTSSSSSPTYLDRKSFFKCSSMVLNGPQPWGVKLKQNQKNNKRRARFQLTRLWQELDARVSAPAQTRV